MGGKGRQERLQEWRRRVMKGRKERKGQGRAMLKRIWQL
jgi:hypothetical protein